MYLFKIVNVLMTLRSIQSFLKFAFQYNDSVVRELLFFIIYTFTSLFAAAFAFW